MQQNLFVRMLFVVITIFICVPVLAQPSLSKMQQKLAGEKQNTPQSFYKFELNNKIPTQAGILFSPDMAVQKTNLLPWLANKLALRPGTDAFLQKDKETYYAGTKISKLQQYYKGIKVEHGVIAEVDVDSKVRLLQMEFYPIVESLTTVPVLALDAALQKAMQFVGAQEYVWQNNPTNAPEYQKPTGELVIVEDMYNFAKGIMSLAYKFGIFASKPASNQYVYVDVVTGKIVFSDIIAKHLNDDQHKKTQQTNGLPLLGNPPLAMDKAGLTRVPDTKNKVTAFELGTGFLRYSGNQNFTTEKFNDTQFRLQGTRGAEFDKFTPYATFNANGLIPPALSINTITDYTDNDNDWTAVTYIDSHTQAALDAHWGIEKVIDYWEEVQGRRSYDNANGRIIAVCNYGTNYDGAFWNSQGKTLFCGNGGIRDGIKVNFVTSLDVISHELGHAICDFTAGLVYKRESGALNEGFSDIWAACVDNYANIKEPALNKKPFLIADQIMDVPDLRDCLRDMTAPTNWGQPDTYKNTDGFWYDANVENCPVPITSDDPVFGNDFCGVHRNSGVLNKWFYLITRGDTSTNGFNQAYEVAGLGFGKAERIAYFTEMILTPNSGFEAARIASLNAVQILSSSANPQLITLADTAVISKAWAAVGVTTDSIYTMSNTPIFASNNFTTVAVGSRGYIWAGTANNGLYKYNGSSWQKAPNLTNHNIAQILPDRDGGIWIAQFGRTGAQAILGGIGYYKDTSFTYQQYSESDGLPTRNVRGVFVNNDLALLPAQKLKRIWAACFADLTVGISRPGSVVFGKETPTTGPPVISFNKQKNGVNQSNGFCAAIGGNKGEVWAFASSNSIAGAGQLLRYRTTDSVFLGAIDNTNQSAFAPGFNIKAIYYDNIKRRWWFGLTTGGLVVLDSSTGSWNKINFPAIFPTGTIIGSNAITGDTRGNIYIGSNNGMIFFGSPNAATVVNPTTETDYKRYTMADGLPSNNVKGIAVDNRASRLVLATDSGIAFRHILCTDCIKTGPVYSLMPGNWSNPGIWASGQVPGLRSNVVVRHAILIDHDANCNSLRIQGAGNVTVNTGITLNVEATNYNSNSNNLQR